MFLIINKIVRILRLKDSKDEEHYKEDEIGGNNS